MTWDEYFLNLANAASLKSKDTTKVGCIIIGEDKQLLSSGWNGKARGVDDNIPERNERPAKYDWVVHAEANAIANAARSGTALKNSKAYVTHAPCKNCAALLIQAGVVSVVCGHGTTVGDFALDIARTQFEEAGVEYRVVVSD